MSDSEIAEDATQPVQDVPLSAEECQRLRALLAQFDTLAQSCPMARQLLGT